MPPGTGGAHLMVTGIRNGAMVLALPVRYSGQVWKMVDVQRTVQYSARNLNTS